MAKKKVFPLRLDPTVIEAVEKWSADEFRSTNGQIEWIITRALKEFGRYKNKSTDTNNSPENGEAN